MSDFQKTEYPKDNGWGRAWRQQQKTNPKAPDFTGNAEIMGEPLKFSAWINQDGSLSYKFRPMTADEHTKYLAKKAELKARREADASQHTNQIRQNIEPVQPKTPMPDPNIDDEIPF